MLTVISFDRIAHEAREDSMMCSKVLLCAQSFYSDYGITHVTCKWHISWYFFSSNKINNIDIFLQFLITNLLFEIPSEIADISFFLIIWQNLMINLIFYMSKDLCRNLYSYILKTLFPSLPIFNNLVSYFVNPRIPTSKLYRLWNYRQSFITYAPISFN